MKTSIKTFAFGGSALAALLASPAVAQSQPSSDAVGEVVASTDAADRAGDIIVTAQKRAERIENVPISITAVSGDTLTAAGVSASSQLPQLVPSLRIDYSGSFAAPTLRGVGSASAGNGLSSNVATYVDGFYVPSQQANDFQLLSVTNVSVLKGPQGTLFGRNATGGAILVTTRDPSFDTTGIASVSYARFDHVTMSGYFSTGLSERIAADVSAIYDHGDGFLRNIAFGGKPGRFERYTIRSKLLFEASDSVRFILGYQHNHTDDPTTFQLNLHNGLGVAAFVPGAVIATRRGEVSLDYKDAGFKLNANTLTLKAEADLDFATLTSYSMYRAQQTRSSLDFDQSNIPIFHLYFPYRQKSYSQELNLTSKAGGRLDWVLGLYYFHDNDRQTDFQISVGGAPFVPGFLSHQVTSAGAAFADGTYEIADSLFITAGLRYSIERKSADYLTQSVIVGPLGGDSASKTWRSLTPRLVARYEIGDRTNIYASWSRGFKSGAFNPSGQNVSDPVNPEKIDAFEVGFKTASPLIRFNTSAYYYDYTDLQISSYVSAQGVLRNAAAAEIYGADADVVFNPMPDLELRAGAAYTHARFKDFKNAPVYIQCLDFATCGAAFGTFIPTGLPNASGYRLPRAPDFTGNLGISYVLHFGDDAKLTLNGDLYHTSRVFFDPVEQFGQKAYDILNLRATYAFAGDKLQIALFGTNVTGTTYVNQVIPAALSIGQTYGEPTSYGVAFTAKF